MKTNILWVSGHSILRHDIFALNCRQKKGKKGRHIVPRITVVFPYIDKMHSMTIFFVIDRSQ